VLDRRAQVLPADPGVGWNRPEDLSARIRLGWDTENLYVTTRVHDPIHHPTTDGPTGFWEGDSLQMGFDPRNDAGAEGGYGAHDVELGLVLGANGMRANQTYPTSRRLDIPVSGERVGGETIYRAAIPWSLLGIRPGAGKVLAFDLIVNQKNGAGRAYWLGITPGIGESKRPSSLSQDCLQELHKLVCVHVLSARNGSFKSTPTQIPADCLSIPLPLATHGVRQGVVNPLPQGGLRPH
jgi:hypothetical protein